MKRLREKQYVSAHEQGSSSGGEAASDEISLQKERPDLIDDEVETFNQDQRSDDQSSVQDDEYDSSKEYGDEEYSSDEEESLGQPDEDEANLEIRQRQHFRNQRKIHQLVGDDQEEEDSSVMDEYGDEDDAEAEYEDEYASDEMEGDAQQSVINFSNTQETAIELDD